MATFMINFQTRRARKPLGSAFIDLDCSGDAITSRVEEAGGSVSCECCRGRAFAEDVRDEAYRRGIVPKGSIEAYVFDVSADPRISDDQKHRLLKSNDRVVQRARVMVEATGVTH